jgi:hypothetical protein
VSLEEQILEILLGLKTKDDNGLWHVYDADGNEISDPGGILLRGNMGALLMWPNPVIEEIVQQYHGGGRRQFSDASQDDILRMVQDMWEAIERDQFRDATKKVDPATPPSVSEQAPSVPEQSLEVPSIIAEHWGVSITNSDRPSDVSLSDSKARRAREEEALVLALLELA